MNRYHIVQLECPACGDDELGVTIELVAEPEPQTRDDPGCGPQFDYTLDDAAVCKACGHRMTDWEVVAHDAKVQRYIEEYDMRDFHANNEDTWDGITD